MNHNNTKVNYNCTYNYTDKHKSESHSSHNLYIDKHI